MIETASSPPVTTWADLNPGQAYRSGIGEPWMKTDQPTTSVRLTDGLTASNIDPAEVVTPAPSATFTLFP